MADTSSKGFCLELFRKDFDALMSKVRDYISELDRAGAELHHKVDGFCRS